MGVWKIWIANKWRPTCIIRMRSFDADKHPCLFVCYQAEHDKVGAGWWSHVVVIVQDTPPPSHRTDPLPQGWHPLYQKKNQFCFVWHFFSISSNFETFLIFGQKKKWKKFTECRTCLLKCAASTLVSALVSEECNRGPPFHRLRRLIYNLLVWCSNTLTSNFDCFPVRILVT